MTKAFLETMVLKPDNEKFVIEAFSKKNLKKVKDFETNKTAKLKKTSKRKISINEISILA
jgi:ATP phosphoribosyltransferase regulatory subunit HisZ